MESLFDLAAFICAVLFGAPAIPAVPLAYVMIELIFSQLDPVDVFRWVSGYVDIRGIAV
jgi:hypothetical protein